MDEAIRSSGLPWTISRPTFFMQNTVMAAQTIAADGVIYWDMRDGELSMIDVRDIVDAAVAGLGGRGPGWIAQGYGELSQGFSENFASKATGNVAELSGHPARSFEQLVRDLAQVLGG